MYDRSNEKHKGGYHMKQAHLPSLHSMQSVEEHIKENKLAFLYVTMPNCSVCHGLLPQIETMLAQYPLIEARQIDASEVPAFAGQFQIFTAPVLLLFVEGKEYIREARIVQTAKLDENIAKIYKNMVD